MALSLINSNVFEHCRITLKLDNANFFPQLGLFTRCSAIADFFIAFLTAILFSSFSSLIYEVIHLGTCSFILVVRCREV